MPPYKKMYFHLFNAITDALQKLNEQEYLHAQDILKEAQCWGEDQYIEAEDNAKK